MTEPSQVDTVLRVGETVAVPTKSPVYSYRWWGAVVAILSWGLVVAVKRGWLPEEIRQPVQDLSLEVIAGMIGTVAALFGGWTASQPLGWTRSHATKVVKTLAAAALITPLLAGCTTKTGEPMSMASRLLLAKQTHTAAKNTASTLIEAGLIKDQPTKDAVWYASEEVRKGLEDADARIAANDRLGFDYVMRRVASALDQLATINARHRAATGPQSRGALWTPRRLPPSFSQALPSWRSSRTPSTAPTAASRPQTTTAARWTLPRPRAALA